MQFSLSLNEGVGGLAGLLSRWIAAGLILFIICAIQLPSIAAEQITESIGDAGGAADKESSGHVNYDEIAAIFKKHNGKLDYTVEQIKTLKRAKLSQTKLTDAEFKKLSSLDQVLMWNLGRCHQLTRESLPVIKSLTNARAIDLADTKGLFNDYDEIADTFKDYKNLEFLSIHLVGKEPTEKYKEFLKTRPQLIALVGVYSTKVEGGYRLKHKEALRALIEKWEKEGVITQEELKLFK